MKIRIVTFNRVIQDIFKPLTLLSFYFAGGFGHWLLFALNKTVVSISTEGKPLDAIEAVKRGDFEALREILIQDSSQAMVFKYFFLSMHVRLVKMHQISTHACC